MVRKPRVAVYGGDGRDENFEWPRHLDVQIYPSRSTRTVERLRESLSTGSIDHLVVLTGYVGHGHTAAVRNAAVGLNVINWTRSPGQLRKELGRLIPAPAEPFNPLLTPTSLNHPGTGGGRGLITTKEAIMAEAEKTTVPMFEHVVAAPPKPDETLGQSLIRILRAEKMTQADLARLLSKDSTTVNGWIKDRGLPADMGPLVDLWPELARFDRGHRYKVAPTAAEAEIRTAEDTKDRIRKELVQGVQAKLKALPVPQPKVDVDVPKDPGRLIGPDLANAITRWRRAKEDLETTERYLLMLLRESGL
jgi:DNA-binding transcriptional regulator YiaG